LLGSENLEWREIHRLISKLCGVAGPHVHTNHTSAFLAAAVCEALSRLTGAKPLTTRTQAKMVGRYYWYSHDRAAAELGYRPRPAERALADAITWLVASPHISPYLRTTLRLNVTAA